MYYTLIDSCRWRVFLTVELINMYYVTMFTHLLLTHDWERCLTCHSSYVQEAALWVDSQKAGVGLKLEEEVQEVKVDLLMKEKFGSVIK